MEQRPLGVDKELVVAAYDVCFQECMKVAKDTRNIWVALVAQNCAIAIAHQKEKVK